MVVEYTTKEYKEERSDKGKLQALLEVIEKIQVGHTLDIEKL